MARRSSGVSSVILFLVSFVAAISFLAFSLVSYSDGGYTLTHYPGEQFSEFVVCVEGEVNPTDQYFTINDSADGKPTVNPFVTINGARYSYNATLKDEGLYRSMQDLKLGCNRVKFGSSSDSEFTLTLRYKPRWRPVVKDLQIKGLRSGEYARFFVDVEGASGEGSLRTKMSIKDVTNSYRQPVIFEETFEGLGKEVKLDLANYIATMKVFDGVAWSDTYETYFTATVVRTDEFLYVKKVDSERDDAVQEWGGWVPVTVSESDDPLMRKMGRGVDGMYVLSWRTINYLRGISHRIRQDYLG